LPRFPVRNRYLGGHGTDESRMAHERLIADSTAAGCPLRPVTSPKELTIAEPVLAYWRHVKACHRPQTRV